MSRNFYILAGSLGLFALVSAGMSLVPSSFQPGLPANGSLWRMVAVFLLLLALAAALIGAHAAARAVLPLLMFFLPPARSDGLSHAAGAPTRESAAAGAVLGFLILIGCVGFAPAAVTAIVLAIVLAIIARLSAAQIGGQTGDVCGALEQVGEIAVLVVASTAG